MEFRHVIGLVMTCACISGGEVCAGGLEGKKGKSLQVWMSADDAVCGKVFAVLDDAITHHKRAENKGDFFIKWRVNKNIKTGTSFEADVSEADIDNDGAIDLLVRRPYIDRTTPYGESLDVFTAQEYEPLAIGQVELFPYAINHAKWHLNFSTTGKADNNTMPRTGYDGWYKLIKSRPYRHNKPWFFWGEGEVSPFVMNGSVYLLVNTADTEIRNGDIFYHYRRRFPGLSIAWGVVVRFRPDGTADDICQFQPKGMP